MSDPAIDYLRNALTLSKVATDSILEFPSWAPAHFGLLFRQSCLGSKFVSHAVNLNYEPVDLNTSLVHDRLRDPEIALMLDAATRASLGCQLLFDAPVKRLSKNETARLGIARKLYFDVVSMRANNALFDNRAWATTTRLDDFKTIAIGSFLYAGAPASTRSWAALIQEDVRWCMACPAGDVGVRAALKAQFPETATWLDAFDVHQQVYPLREALSRTWDLDTLRLNTPLIEYSLPDLAY